jgi:hypothetical protein
MSHTPINSPRREIIEGYAAQLRREASHHEEVAGRLWKLANDIENDLSLRPEPRPRPVPPGPVASQQRERPAEAYTWPREKGPGVTPGDLDEWAKHHPIASTTKPAGWQELQAAEIRTGVTPDEIAQWERDDEQVDELSEIKAELHRREGPGSETRSHR